LGKGLEKNPFEIRNLGAFLAQSAKNRAFRCKSSEAPMRFLWAFRCNPLRMAAQNQLTELPVAIPWRIIASQLCAYNPAVANFFRPN
jgi:hypothetical protein